MIAAPQNDPLAEEREYQAKLRIVIDRLEFWVKYRRVRNRIDGPSGESVLSKLAAEVAESKRRRARVRVTWICCDCDHIHLVRPKECAKCRRTVFRKGDGPAGKVVSAAMIPGTGGGVQDWSKEIATDDAIRLMPYPLRVVLKLNYLDWRTQEEKADEVGRSGISVATFRARLSMAYQWLIGYGQRDGWFADLANR